MTLLRKSKILFIFILVYLFFNNCGLGRKNSTKSGAEARVSFHEGDSTIKQIIQFDKYARSTGLRAYFYQNGTVKWQEQRKAGQLNGSRLMYYRSGNVKCMENFKDGRKEGISYYFYPSGHIMYLSEWSDDTLTENYFKLSLNGEKIDVHPDSIPRCSPWIFKIH